MTATLRPSGPPGTFVTGNLSDFARDPLGFLERASHDYGPVASFRFGRTRALLLSDPALIEEVLVKRRDSFIKARALRALSRLFGKGLLTSEGDYWRKQRRLAQPAFHPGSMHGHSAVVVARASRMFASWKDGEEMDFHSSMKELLMGIVAESLFGGDVADRASAIGAALESTMDHYAGRRGFARLAPDWVLLAETRRYLAGVAELEAFVRDVVSSRRKSGEKKNDLLSMLLTARNEDGTGMSDSQIRDEAITLFVGGFDTPALSMSWTWYLLSNNPESAAALVAEVDRVLAGRDPAIDDISQLAYTQQVVKESMRLYPPAWLLSREAVEDTTIGGREIPRGMHVMMSPWVTHRDERLFDDPLVFNPDRWGPDSTARLPKFAYFPFGGGPRVCIGAAFAMMETTLILAMLAQRFRFGIRDGVAIKPRASMTLRPDNGVPIVIARR